MRYNSYSKLRKEKARKTILTFSTKYDGKEFKPSELDNNDLYAYILTDTYLAIDAMLGYDADVNIILNRAIQRADEHKKNLDAYRVANKDKVVKY